MSEDVVRLARAVDFAARKHTNQKRKGAAAEPYLNHLTEVALMVAEATEGRDLVAVMGAYLHDTIEDTNATREELEDEFGAEVAALVAEVTDDKSRPKAERKATQVRSAPHKSERAKLVKIADKISNLNSLLSSPPTDWEDSRKREYVDWAAQVVAGCRGVNARLDASFDQAYARAKQLL